MKEQPYFLILTADELTWKFDRPVIFLGEWCRRFNRRDVWKNMVAKVAAPYGCEKAKKDSDRIEAKLLEQKYFPLLCCELNRVHKVNYDDRFWRILLGSWFERYVKLILNRVRTLELCLKTYHIDSVAEYSEGRYSLATEDSYTATWASNDDTWNNYLLLKILDEIPNTKISKEIAVSSKPDWFKLQETERIVSLKSKITNLIYHQSRNLARIFIRNSDAMIISSYLSLKIELMLQVALGQFPQWFIAQKLDLHVKPNVEIRKDLTNRMKNETGELLEEILQALLFQLLPMCYLEGFEHLNKLTNEQSWPSNPKFIFSSNNFEYDEIFKLWTAKQTSHNTTLVFGQHGNNYGTHRYIFPTVEETVCDRFLTWGWSGGLAQHTPAFLLRDAGKRFKNNNPFGTLLLIETHDEHRNQTWDTTFEFLKYFDEQQIFVKHLKLKPKKHLVVRLPLASHQMFGFENDRWEEIDRTIEIEPGVRPMGDLLSESRLVVHSYDSTGILETLSRNIPTLAFWQNNLDHLRESVIDDYELLVDAGIVHLTPESAAKMVNEVWDDIDGWWQQKKVQNARIQFCEQYARTSQHPVRDLKKILVESSNKPKLKN